MNISLPDDLHKFVLERVEAGCYGSASEYIRTLVRRDRDERPAKTKTMNGWLRRANDYLHAADHSPAADADRGNCPSKTDLVS